MRWKNLQCHSDFDQYARFQITKIRVEQCEHWTTQVSHWNTPNGEHVTEMTSRVWRQCAECKCSRRPSCSHPSSGRSPVLKVPDYCPTVEQIIPYPWSIRKTALDSITICHWDISYNDHFWGIASLSTVIQYSSTLILRPTPYSLYNYLAQ